MARPQKCGMDYFPHDTDALTDEKIEALRMLYGNDGYAFYFILLERIYRTECFELDISDAETIQILSRKIGVTEDLFHKMLATSLKRGCFDVGVFEERSCLTSNGIKKRADVVISKRKASKKTYEEKISATETNQENGQEIDTESTQSKGEKRKEEKKENNKTFSSDSIEYRLSDYLFKHMLKNNPECKHPNLDSWAKDIDLMIRIDNRNHEEIKSVIEWCQKDIFWSKNILSTSKLRKQYDQLILNKNADKSQAKTNQQKQYSGFNDYMGES